MSLDDQDGKPENRDHYEVGKNKPPKEHQFKKGDDWRGNRRGRPNGSLNFDKAMRKAFSEILELTENGKKRKLNGTQAMSIKFRNDTLKGKPYAAKIATEWHQREDARNAEETQQELSQNHQEIVDKALERLAKKQKRNE